MKFFYISREHCAGTHVLRTSELEDFVITKFGKASYCVKNIEAVVGEEAVAIRQRDEENKKKLHLLSEKMKNLRDPEISQVFLLIFFSNCFLIFER